MKQLNQNLIRQTIAQDLLCISSQQHSEVEGHGQLECVVDSVQRAQITICLASLSIYGLSVLIPGKSESPLSLKSLRQNVNDGENKKLLPRMQRPSLSCHICSSFPLLHPHQNWECNCFPVL